MTVWWTISYQAAKGAPWQSTLISAPSANMAWQRWGERRAQLLVDQPEAWFDYYAAAAHPDHR